MVNMRTINCKLDVLTRTDSSVLFSQGETVLVAGIYGPIEAKQAKMSISKATVEAYYRPKAGLPGINDRLQESIIEDTVESVLVSALYPRAAVVAVIQEMQNKGSVMACAVNAACLALLNSNVDMKFAVAGVGCIIDGDNRMRLDPSSSEEQKARATFLFVFDSVVRNIVISYTLGSFSSDEYQEALGLCKEASVDIFAYYKSVVSVR